MKKKLSALLCLALTAVISLNACTRLFSQDENDAFLKFTADLFRQEVSSSAITLHYTLKYPEKYGVENTPVTLGAYTADPTALSASCENTLAVLDSFRRQKLSRENRLTYDVLRSYLTESLHAVPFALYEEPLSPLTGVQSQLPILLSEYPFYSDEALTVTLLLSATCLSILLPSSHLRKKNQKPAFSCLPAALRILSKNAVLLHPWVTAIIYFPPFRSGLKLYLTFQNSKRKPTYPSIKNW